MLPRSPTKNQLREALECQRYEVASRVIASSSESTLVECFEGKNSSSLKSFLHIIAAMSDTKQSTELCRQLLAGINNRKSR